MERRLFSYYDSFVAYVARSREMEEKKVGEVAQGRVWTGSQALKQGLVDEIGGYYESIRSAAAQAGLGPGEYEVHEIEASAGWLGMFGDEAWSEARRAAVDKHGPVSVLLTPKLLRDLLWVSTVRDSPFLYLSPLTPPDA
jgi:ClpP class serine protease